MGGWVTCLSCKIWMSIIIQLCGMISSSEENELEGKMLQILFTGEKKNTALFLKKKKKFVISLSQHIYKPYSQLSVKLIWNSPVCMLHKAPLLLLCKPCVLISLLHFFPHSQVALLYETSWPFFICDYFDFSKVTLTIVVFNNAIWISLLVASVAPAVVDRGSRRLELKSLLLEGLHCHSRV